MCKKTLIPLAVLVLGVGWTCPLVAQSEMPSEEEAMRQMQLIQNVMEGMMPGPQMFTRGGKDSEERREKLGVSEEQMQKISEGMREAAESFQKEMSEKFGNHHDLSPEKRGEAAEALVGMLPKLDEVSDKVMRETWSVETIKRIETVSFQKYGGTFGGALNVKNLAPLNLSDEQKAKAKQIVSKLNRERLELIFSLDAKPQDGQMPDIAGITEKIISLTRRGQREIEALLSPEQKKLAEELMADVPEEYRFLNDYLANRPWRLDESSWNPGDGPPPTMENWPGEMRPERSPRGERVFHEN